MKYRPGAGSYGFFIFYHVPEGIDPMRLTIFTLHFLTCTSLEKSLKIPAPQFGHMQNLNLISILAHNIFLSKEESEWWEVI